MYTNDRTNNSIKDVVTRKQSQTHWSLSSKGINPPIEIKHQPTLHQRRSSIRCNIQRKCNFREKIVLKNEKKKRNTKSTHTSFSPRSNISPLFTTRVQRHTDKPIPEHSQGGPAIRVAARERVVEDPGAGGHQQVSTTRRRRDRGKGETIVHCPTKRTYQLGRGTKRTL